MNDDDTIVIPKPGTINVKTENFTLSAESDDGISFTLPLRIKFKVMKKYFSEDTENISTMINMVKDTAGDDTAALVDELWAEEATYLFKVWVEAIGQRMLNLPEDHKSPAGE